MNEIYVFALLVCLASTLAIFLRRFQLPLVVSYLLSGMIVGLFGFNSHEKLQFLRFLPEIGLAFLLFLVGIELDFRQFKSFGKNVIIAAIAQIAISSLAFYALLTNFFGSSAGAILAAIGLSFSSTILVVKSLTEGKDLASFHGKIAIGVLLLEDLVAVIVLSAINLYGKSNSIGVSDIVIVAVKTIFLIYLALLAGKKILPKIFKITAENSELLFVTAISWCLAFVALAQILGLSVGIGAFLAGISLAQSDYRLAIAAKIKPLRDFFIMIFFIDLAAGINFTDVGIYFPFAIYLVSYMLLIKPIIFFLIFSIYRFRAHTSFRTATLLSSVSEFSLIILYTGSHSGVISSASTSIATFATVMSFMFSSFLIFHTQNLYRLLNPILKKFERKKTISLDSISSEKEFTNHAILIGCHRSGEIIAKMLQKYFPDNTIILDFNPEVIEKLKDSFIPCLYGDISDPEIQERLNLKNAKIIISTVRDLPDNLTLLDALEKIQSKAIVIITAADEVEAVTLYERGAHHVSLPTNLEGKSISRLLYDYSDNLPHLAREREKKLGELKRSNSINQ